MTRPRLLTLFAAHLAGNAALLCLGYYWLGVGESDAAHLAFSVGLILFFTLAVLWLHGTSLVFFRNDKALASAALRSGRNLLPLFVLSLFVLLIYAALQHFYVSFGHEAFNIGSYSTMKLRRPVEPTRVLKAFHILIWILRWFVVPVFALPLAAEVANRGWSGFKVNAFRRSRKLLFWMEAGVLLVATVYLPLQLFYWIPKMPSFALEVVSVTARMGLGYFLFTAGLLAVEYFTSAGNPRVTQPNTVVSP